MVVLGLFEGTAFAAAAPAIYLLVARSSPIGRTLDRAGHPRGVGDDRHDRRVARGGPPRRDIDLRAAVLDSRGTVTLIALVIGLLARPAAPVRRDAAAPDAAPVAAPCPGRSFDGSADVR